MSFFVCNEYPFSVVSAFAVTLWFVQSLGVFVIVVFAFVSFGTVAVVTSAALLMFPASSFTHT